MGSTVFERRTPSRSVVEHALSDTAQAVFWLQDSQHSAGPRLTGTIAADLVIVGGGYTGLWSALLAKEREPERRVVVVEASTIGWAASGRNGGFVEASLTHGRENGERRWPKEVDRLDQLGADNLDQIVETVQRYAMAVDLEQTGLLQVAVEQHQIPWMSGDGVLDAEKAQAEVASPTYLGARYTHSGTAIVHPAKLVHELARVARNLGVEIFEHSPVTAVRGRAPVRVETRMGAVIAGQAVLATNVFPSLLRRNGLMTVPVYDYVLMTEPLSSAQLDSIGWRNRQGIVDLANQFHYYRLSSDNRILFGGYDAVYHLGGRIRPAYENRPESHRRLAQHFFTTFPQLEGVKFSHKWAGVIDTCTRFCAFYGTSRDRSIAYALGFTGLGVGATRFAANVMLDLLSGDETERTSLQMVRERPLPFPPEPIAAAGINATRWALNRADHNGGQRNLLLKTLDSLGLGFDS